MVPGRSLPLNPLNFLRKGKRRMAIRDLASHSAAYVTVSELASYWRVSRKQIYKQIEAGILPTIRLGPRLVRITTIAAREFEDQARMVPATIAANAKERKPPR